MQEHYDYEESFESDLVTLLVEKKVGATGSSIILTRPVLSITGQKSCSATTPAATDSTGCHFPRRKGPTHGACPRGGYAL